MPPPPPPPSPGPGNATNVYAIMPTLPAGYIFQLLPALGHWIMTIIGPKRVAQYRGGGGGYDLGSMLKRSARQ